MKKSPDCGALGPQSGDFHLSGRYGPNLHGFSLFQKQGAQIGHRRGQREDVGAELDAKLLLEVAPSGTNACPKSRCLRLNLLLQLFKI